MQSSYISKILITDIKHYVSHIRITIRLNDDISIGELYAYENKRFLIINQVPPTVEHSLIPLTIHHLPPKKIKRPLEKAFTTLR